MFAIDPEGQATVAIARGLRAQGMTFRQITAALDATRGDLWRRDMNNKVRP